MPVPRSYLFVPGNRPDRFAKALAAGADVVILDLEDAVPPAEKIAARDQVAAWLSSDRPVVVRVNGFGSEWCHDDLRMCRHAGVAGVMLPKADRVDQIHAVSEQAGRSVSILPIVETAQGLWNAESLARAPQVQRLAFGSIDFSIDLNLGGDEDDLLYYRSHLVLASRVAGLEPPIDGVTTTFDAPERVRADARRAKKLGFGAKLCIHPRQIAPVHEAFGPTEGEVVWARRVMAAAERSAGAATALDGAMVDRPVIARAEAILASLAASSQASPASPVEEPRRPDR